MRPCLGGTQRCDSRKDHVIGLRGSMAVGGRASFVPTEQVRSAVALSREDGTLQYRGGRFRGPHARRVRRHRPRVGWRRSFHSIIGCITSSSHCCCCASAVSPPIDRAADHRGTLSQSVDLERSPEGPLRTTCTAGGLLSCLSIRPPCRRGQLANSRLRPISAPGSSQGTFEVPPSSPREICTSRA